MAVRRCACSDLRLRAEMATPTLFDMLRGLGGLRHFPEKRKQKKGDTHPLSQCRTD